MLTSADDTLWHQLPTTFDHVGTSDPRFFDRYWFASYAPDGTWAVHVTLGAYRNMDVMDAGVVVVRQGRQYNLRASRTLGAEIQSTCGPISVEVHEPLERFALRVEDSSGYGLDLHLDWRATSSAMEEKPHFQRRRRRVVMDYQRFNQIGEVNGSVQGGEHEGEVSEWWGCRDHSWGVRPRMGIPEPSIGQRRSLEDRGFAMAFLFFSTSRLAGYLHLQHHHGDSPYVTGEIRDSVTGTHMDVQDLDLEVDLYPGTRRFRSALLTVESSEGESLPIRIDALGSAIAMQGLGYSGGFDDGAGLGVWRGDSHVETDIWDVSQPAVIGYGDGRSGDHWHRIQPVSVSVSGTGDHQTGTGSMTLILSGHLPDYGLE